MKVCRNAYWILYKAMSLVNTTVDILVFVMLFLILMATAFQRIARLYCFYLEQQILRVQFNPIEETIKEKHNSKNHRNKRNRSHKGKAINPDSKLIRKLEPGKIQFKSTATRNRFFDQIKCHNAHAIGVSNNHPTAVAEPSSIRIEDYHLTPTCLYSNNYNNGIHYLNNMTFQEKRRINLAFQCVQQHVHGVCIHIPNREWIHFLLVGYTIEEMDQHLSQFLRIFRDFKEVSSRNEREDLIEYAARSAEWGQQHAIDREMRTGQPMSILNHMNIDLAAAAPSIMLRSEASQTSHTHMIRLPHMVSITIFSVKSEPEKTEVTNGG